MKRVFIHKSGRKTFVNTELTASEFTIRDKNGKADEVVEEIRVKEISDEAFEKIMEQPQDFDIKKHGTGRVFKKGRGS